MTFLEELKAAQEIIQMHEAEEANTDKEFLREGFLSLDHCTLDINSTSLIASSW